MFQFTHPGRGATSSAVSDLILFSVSIHAPREGCDYKRDDYEGTDPLFQFTHPGRGATSRMNFSLSLNSSFNSRTPGGVRRTAGALCFDLFLVSIHAPREGCDLLEPRTKSVIVSFNSRTPGGVRLIDKLTD